MRPRTILALASCWTLAACGGSSTSTSDVSIDRRPQQSQSQLSTTDQLELASVLALANPQRIGGPGVPLPALSADLAREFAGVADAVLRSLAFEVGGGVNSLWSTFVQKLAEHPNAPEDKNANGTNRDETLAELRERFAFRSNGAMPTGVAPSYVLPSQLSMRLVRAPQSRDDYGALRLAPVAASAREFESGQIGATILAYVRQAAAWLSVGRGDLYGKSSAEGHRGLLMLEQAIAAERLLLDELAYDGRSLGRVRDPAKYDPSTEPRVFPARLRFDMSKASDPSLPDQPKWGLIDRGSDLRSQARILRGCAELAWLASEQQAHPLLQRLFRGDPFGKLPSSQANVRQGQRSGSAIHGLSDVADTASPGSSHVAHSASVHTNRSASARLQRRPEALDLGEVGHLNNVVNWEDHIRGVLQGNCSGRACHDSGKSGGFSVANYKDVLAGGTNNATHPAVVKGKRAESLLYNVLLMNIRNVASRMPLGGPPWLSSAEIELVGEWIDKGALEKDNSVPEIDPLPGLDGIRVVLANLAAFHLDKTSGALVDRADLDGRGVTVMPDSAGAILTALAAVADARPELANARKLLLDHALFCAKRLVASDGIVAESFRLDIQQASAAPAELGEAAQLVAGLFDAERILGRSEVLAAARLAADALLRKYTDGGSQGLTSFPAAPALRWTPGTLARVLELAKAWYAETGDRRARDLIGGLWTRAKAAGVLLAEWPASGELFGDGNRDSDGDGVPEVGTGLLPPLFASAVVNQAYLRGQGIPERSLHYSRDLLPLLLRQCSECHSGNANLGDFRLDSYSDLFDGGSWRDRTKSIVPGDPAKSFFYRKLVDRPPQFGRQMPEARPPMSPEARELVRQWILKGAVRD